jgi:hypothetical protein
VERLIRIFGSKRAVVLFGAGPSSEIGLPSWPSLTRDVLDSVKEKHGVDSDGARKALADGRLPYALGQIERVLAAKGLDGRGILEETVIEHTADNSTTGHLYSLLAQLPAHLFLTTNYDAVFERHLRVSGAVPEVLTNTRESIELYDPASYDVTLMHVHGSTVHGGALVITDADYQRVIDAGSFKALREFLSAQLATGPVVFLGYGLGDPDLLAMAREVAGVLRRKHPVLAVLPDCARDAASVFAENFNIDVLTYDSHGSHQELRAMLSATLKWLQSPQVKQVLESADLRLAEALYLQEAVRKAGEPLEQAALRSLLLSVLCEREDVVSEALQADVKKLSGYSEAKGGHLGEVVDRCVEDGLVTIIADRISLTEEGRHMVDVSTRKYRRLWLALAEHVDQRLGGGQPLGPILERVLVDLFSRRASEAVNLSLKNQPLETSSLSLFELVSAPAGEIEDAATRLAFIEYVIDMLRSPNATQKAVVDHLGRSLFCAHALRLDVDAQQVVHEFLAQRVLLVDSHLLISLLARHSPQHASTVQMIETCQRLGVRLFTTYGLVQEVLGHAGWARTFAAEHSGDEATLLAAARGFGVWDGNDFLSGVIVEAGLTGKRQTVGQYVSECLGAEHPTVEQVADRLEADWGIRFLCSRSCAATSPAFYEVRDGTYTFIDQRANESKTDTRMRTEAEAYAAIHEWNPIGLTLGLPGDAYLLSFGGFLNKVAFEGPHPVGRNVVITPYALTAFLETYVNPDAAHSFGEIIRAEYFNCASDLLEEEDLARYFAGVISSADRAYETELKPRLLALGQELVPFDVPNDLSEVPEVERPEVVRGIAAYISQMVSPEERRRLVSERQTAERRASNAEDRAARAEALLEKRKKGQARYEKAEKRRKGE